MKFERALANVLADLDLDLTANQFAALAGHYALLARWSRRINLTAVRAAADAAVRHYGESLFLHKQLPPLTDAADVGSGAGFPGIPLAVLRPETHFHLIESVGKKTAFLREAARNLENVSIACCRLADWPGRAEWAVMRAVAPEKVLGALETRFRRVALLGAKRPPSGRFRWQDPIDLPWGERRRVWISFT